MSKLIVAESDERKYWTQIPNIIDDTEMSVHAHRLYCHIKRVAGDFGKCYQNTKTLASACNMSAGSVSKAKKELVSLRLIEVKSIKDNEGEHHEIKVIDVWPENMEKYSCSPCEHVAVHPVNDLREEGGSPGETKKNTLLKNPPVRITNMTNEEITSFLMKVPGDTYNLAQTFCVLHDRPPTDQEEKYWRKCWNEQHAIGITAADIAEAYSHMSENNLTIKSPGSVTAVAERYKKEREEKEAGFSGEVVKMGEIEYPLPKSRTTVP